MILCGHQSDQGADGECTAVARYIAVTACPDGHEGIGPVCPEHLAQYRAGLMTCVQSGGPISVVQAESLQVPA